MLEHPVQFDRFHLDPLDARLWRGGQAIPVTPKAFSVLSCLVEHAGQLVTKEQLLHTVWEDRLVSDAAIVVCVREVRRALRDQPRNPRFIETVHRRGYRFIAPVAPVSSPLQVPGTAMPPDTVIGPHAVEAIRQTEAPASRRARVAGQSSDDDQVVIVTGEGAEGETALVQALVHPAARSGFWISTEQPSANHQPTARARVPRIRRRRAGSR